MKFKKYNANPSDKFDTDCSRRAISLAYNIPYNQVKKELNLVRDDLGETSYNYATVTTKYLQDKGAEEIEDAVSLTVEQFCDRYSVGTYLLDVFGEDETDRHLTCIIDGTVYDTWNCQDYTILHAYTVSSNKSNIGFNIQDYRVFVKKTVSEILKNLLPEHNVFVNTLYTSENTKILVKVTIDYRHNYQFNINVPYGTSDPEDYILKLIKKNCKAIVKELV